VITAGPQRIVEMLSATDPDVADRDELAAIVRESRRLRAWIDALDMRCARRGQELASHGQSEPVGALFGTEGGRSSKESKQVTDRAVTCTRMPSFEASLESGEVSAGHIDALANATRHIDEAVRAELVDLQDDLVAAAGQQRVDQFERTCRDLVRHLNSVHAPNADVDELERQRRASRIRRWVDKDSGMHHTHAELDPVRDAKLQSALDAHLRRVRRSEPNSGRPFHQLEVDAFVDSFTAGVTGGSPTTADTGSSGPVEAVEEPPAEWRVPEITILTDLRTIEIGLHERSICETADGEPLPIDTVRRLACDAEVLPAVLDGRGEVRDLGRSKRTVSRGQRRRLRAMHRTCIRPECTVPFERCEIHHVLHWTAHRGPTDIDNLVPLCSHDHHLVHEGGWTITLAADRTVCWIRPDGTVHHEANSIDRAPGGVGPPAPDEPP
jgi:hypothetical protein